MTKESKRPGVVYVVTEVSEPDRVRYVGRTIQPIQTRIQEHWAQVEKEPFNSGSRKGKVARIP